MGGTTASYDISGQRRLNEKICTVYAIAPASAA